MQSSPNGALVETRDRILELLGSELNELTIERAVVGVFFTGVELTNGYGGVCATPVKLIPDAVCCPTSAMAMPLPGRLRGRTVSACLAEVEHDQGLRRALGIAVMNALATLCWDRKPPPNVTMEIGIDALDAARIRPNERVVMVGAFGPYIRKLRRRGQPFVVLEKDPTTLRADEMGLYRPAEQAAAVVPEADVLLVTGTTLVNDTADALLALARPGAEIVMIGPSVSLVPDALFRRGVRVAGGVRVTDPRALLALLAEGGSGHHFFGRSADKVVLIRDAAEETGSRAAAR